MMHPYPFFLITEMVWMECEFKFRNFGILNTALEEFISFAK